MDQIDQSSIKQTNAPRMLKQHSSTLTANHSVSKQKPNTNFSPYIAQIERRKKYKSVIKPRHNNKIQHQSSEKSFRIKEQRSSSSLHSNMGFLMVQQRSSGNINPNGVFASKNAKKEQQEQSKSRNRTIQLKQPKRERQRESQQQQGRKEIESNGLLEKLAKIKANGCHTTNNKKAPKLDRQLSASISRTVDNSFGGITANVIESVHNEKRVQQSSSRDKKLFNDLYFKIQNGRKQKNRKGITFQRSVHKPSYSNNNTIIYQGKREKTAKQQQCFQSVKKLGYTDLDAAKKQKHYSSVQQGGKFLDENTCNLIKKNNKNFRKNKYQALHSSVSTKHREIDSSFLADSRQEEAIKSQNNLIINGQMEKKESNASLNKEMDALAQREMKTFYRQKRGKQFQRSVQKSTEKYLCDETYRPLKSKNDIEIYLSTVTNPRKQKQQISRQSTLNTSNKQTVDQTYLSSNLKQRAEQSKSCTARSQRRAERVYNFLQYDFDFKVDQQIREMENPSEQQSLGNLREEQSQKLTFEQQRKKVELEYFHKETFNLEWSEDEVVNI